MSTSYRYEVERPAAKNLRKALKRQEQRIKVPVLREFWFIKQSLYLSLCFNKRPIFCFVAFREL
jgi:hypothetical protein